MRGSKAPSQRQLRVGELIRHALAEVFARGDLRDPDLEGVALTVVEVSVSPDLKKARAFVMPLGGGNANAVADALNRSKRYLRGQVSQRVSLKHMPDVSFELDTSFDYSRSVDQLLAEPHVAQDLEE